MSSGWGKLPGVLSLFLNFAAVALPEAAPEAAQAGLEGQGVIDPR